MEDIFDSIGIDGFEDELDFTENSSEKEQVYLTFTPKTDYSDWLVRCHQLGDLMTKPKSKDEVLSATAKKMLNKVFNQLYFGKQNSLTTKEMEKGIICEPKAILMYNEVFGTNYAKNEVRLQNEFIEGECDIHDVELSKVIDIKNSWSFETFPVVEKTIPDNDYIWQVQGYMELYGCKYAEVAYCLLDTPLSLVMDEKYKMMRKLGVIDLPENIERQIEDAHIYSHIPSKRRIKIYLFERDKSLMDKVEEKVIHAREYLNELANYFENGEL